MTPSYRAPLTAVAFIAVAAILYGPAGALIMLVAFILLAVTIHAGVTVGRNRGYHQGFIDGRSAGHCVAYAEGREQGHRDRDESRHPRPPTTSQHHDPTHPHQGPTV